MSEKIKQYWFPAKRYGWGWGAPNTWQGWLVLILWIAVFVPISHWLALRSIPLFLLFVVVMSAALVAINYIKGEPPGWRWGGK